jgi:hypothetical protein
MVELIEIAPGRYRVKRTPQNFARSDLPRPFIISDAMPPTEQVDGVFYESKSAFRAVGKKLGLIEVGNSKLPPRQRPSASPQQEAARVQSVKKAMEKVRSK